MNHIKKNIVVLLTMTLLLSFHASTNIEAKGGKQKGMQGGRQERMQKGTQSMRQAGSGGQERKHIHARDRQRDQLRTCTQSAEQVRARARNMEQSAGKSGFNAGQARRECNQLRSEFQAMLQEHERFMRGMDDNQKVKHQNRISKMEQSRDRVRILTQGMDLELNQKADPDPEIIAGQARGINRAMNQWQKQYQYLDSEIKE
jgi:hypothetical protein